MSITSDKLKYLFTRFDNEVWIVLDSCRTSFSTDVSIGKSSEIENCYSCKM